MPFPTLIDHLAPACIEFSFLHIQHFFQLALLLSLVQLELLYSQLSAALFCHTADLVTGKLGLLDRCT